MFSALILSALLSSRIELRISADIDFGKYITRWRNRAGATDRVRGLRCGYRIVGYRVKGEPGEEVRYMGRWYEFRADEPEMLLLATRRPRKDAGELDAFRFAELPYDALPRRQRALDPVRPRR